MATSSVCIHDRTDILRFLQHDLGRYIYEVGDLDDFFWPYTVWYASQIDEKINQLALVYTGTELPVLLAEGGNVFQESVDFLRGLRPFLPRRFYSHLLPGLEQVFAQDHKITSHGRHWKMVLKHPQSLTGVDTSTAVVLSRSNLAALQTLYEQAYPGNWFDARMLDTGQFFGIWQGAQLISVAGIHVYSPKYGVAAIGNITTLPEMRGRGLGTQVTARLCQSLLEGVGVIGLNVLQSNIPAIACYKRLGFEVAAEYEEFMIEA